MAITCVGMDAHDGVGGPGCECRCASMPTLRRSKKPRHNIDDLLLLFTSHVGCDHPKRRGATTGTQAISFAATVHSPCGCPQTVPQTLPPTCSSGRSRDTHRTVPARTTTAEKTGCRPEQPKYIAGASQVNPTQRQGEGQRKYAQQSISSPAHQIRQPI